MKFTGSQFSRVSGNFLPPTQHHIRKGDFSPNCNSQNVRIWLSGSSVFQNLLVWKCERAHMVVNFKNAQHESCNLSFVVISVFQSLSHVWLFATPWTAARQASLSFTISWSFLKLMSIKSVMPSNHLILFWGKMMTIACQIVPRNHSKLEGGSTCNQARIFAESVC